MRLPSAPLLVATVLAVVLGPGRVNFAQTEAGSAVAVNAAPATPSEMLRPALAQVQQTLDGLRLDKWKGAAGMREETDANIKSIRGDLETTLPALLTTADAAPQTPSKVLPVFRNVDALYDVLLRVVETGSLCAPRPQSAALGQAMTSLEGARRALGEHLQNVVVAQEQKLADAQAALRARPVPATVAMPAEVVRVTPTAPHAAKPRKPKAKVVPNPAGSTPGKAATPPQN